MGYKFDPAESLTEAVARVARHEIAIAVTVLNAEASDWREAVHEVRQRFKNLRGLFRLVRAADPDFFDRENRRYRDLGRLLAGQREAGAIVETLERARKDGAARGRRATLRTIRDRLADRERHVHEDRERIGALRAEVTEGCRDGLRAIGGLDLPARRKRVTRVLARGVRREYARGRKALARAHAERRPADFHALRKSVKYHWMHVRLLQPGWPGPMKARHRAARRLARVLGDVQDIAVVLERLADDPNGFGSPEEVEALAGVLHRRRSRLERRSLDAAARLFAEKPGAIGARLAAYYSLAMTEAERKERCEDSGPKVTAPSDT